MTERTTSWRRPLIIGARGQLGAALYEALQQQGVPEILESSRTPGTASLTLDLASLHSAAAAAAAIGPSAPDLILCAGAMTFVDGCEQQQEQAFRANAYGPSAVAAYAHFAGIPFVFFSSDYVFPGTPDQPGPYDENDPTRPLNVYGRSKLEGERAVLRVHPKALVLRTSWVYGPDAAGKNFISSLVRRLRAGEIVQVPADQISTPTYNKDLAQNALQLAQERASGVFHATGPDRLSRLELAQRVAAAWGLNSGLIQGIATSSLGQTAPRPLDSGLVSSRLAAEHPNIRFQSLAEGLAEMHTSLAAEPAGSVTPLVANR